MIPAPDDSEYPLTPRQQMGNEEYTEALGALNKERQRLGVESPCQANPSLWDGIDQEEGESTLELELGRVQSAVSACEACPVLGQCEDVWLANASKHVVDGVVAGLWVDNTKYGGYIRHYLENDEWPEDALIWLGSEDATGDATERAA